MTGSGGGGSVGLDKFREVVSHDKDFNRVDVEQGKVVDGKKSVLGRLFKSGQINQSNRDVYDSFKQSLFRTDTSDDQLAARNALTVLDYDHNPTQNLSTGKIQVVLQTFDQFRTENKVRSWCDDNQIIGETRQRILGNLQGSASKMLVQMAILGIGNEDGSEFPTNLWDLRDSNFKGSNFFKIADSILAIDQNRGQFLDHLEGGMRANAEKRLDHLVDIAKSTKAMQNDNWNEDYVSEIGRHRINLRAEGILNDVAPQLRVVDEGFSDTKFTRVMDVHDLGNARQAFDGQRFSGYLTREGGNPDHILKFSNDQKNQTFNESTVKVARTILANCRVEENELSNLDKVEDPAIPDPDESELKSFQIQHAMSMETLAKIQFEGNDPEGQTVTVFRCLKAPPTVSTQGESLIEGFPGNFKHHVLESTSALWPEADFGPFLQMQKIPHHRVMGSYLQPQLDIPDGEKGMFLMDNERELLIMGSGVDTIYLGPTDRFIDMRTHYAQNAKEYIEMYEGRLH